MKITKQQLRKIIKEEITKTLLNEEDRIFNAKGETQSLKSFVIQIEDTLEDAALDKSKKMTQAALMRIVNVMKNNKGLGRSSIEDATTAALKKFQPPSPERDMVALQYFEKLMDDAGVS